jgi:AbrB family looped-hinge helix DNA binding protein
MEFRTQMSKNGRIILPAKLRKALEIKPGDEIVMQLENGSIRLMPLHQAVSLAQELVRKYVQRDTSLSDGLIQARRAEARDE